MISVFSELFFESEEIFLETQEEKKQIIAQKKRMRILAVGIVSEIFKAAKFTKFIQ